MDSVIIRVFSVWFTSLGMTALYLVGSICFSLAVLHLTTDRSSVEDVIFVALIVMCAGAGYHTAQRMVDHTL